MNTVVVRRTQKAASAGFVPVSSSTCSTCQGCGQAPQEITLPGVHADQAELTLDAASRQQLLWNSWIKPLIAVVAVATGCQVLGMSDLETAVMVVIGFVTGIVCCRQVPAAALTIKEE